MTALTAWRFLIADGYDDMPWPVDFNRRFNKSSRSILGASHEFVWFVRVILAQIAMFICCTKLWPTWQTRTSAWVMYVCKRNPHTAANVRHRHQHPTRIERSLHCCCILTPHQRRTRTHERLCMRVACSIYWFGVRVKDMLLVWFGLSVKDIGLFIGLI